MTAIETAMLIHYALLDGDRLLAQDAYSSYLATACAATDTWTGYIRRYRKLRRTLDGMGVDWL
jgi:hypothetical protein